MMSGTSVKRAIVSACLLFFGVAVPLASAANPFDDIAKNIGDATTKSVSDAVNGAVSSAVNAIGNPAQAPAQNQVSSSASPATPPAAQAPGTQNFRCLEITPAPRGGFHIRNTCSDPIVAVVGNRIKPNFCAHGVYLKDEGAQYQDGWYVLATCRRSSEPVPVGACECAAGTLLTATSATTPIQAVPRKSESDQFPTSSRGCPIRSDDPRWQTLSKGNHCGR